MSSSTEVSQDGGETGVPSLICLLPDEVLASLSPFLDLGDVSSLLLTSRHCAGAKKVIKKKYLRRNFDYLKKCVLTERGQSIGRVILFSNSKIDDWIEANNNDWRGLYRDRSTLSEDDIEIFERYFGNLHGATQLGLVDVVEYLVEHEGADPNQEVSTVSGFILRPLSLAVLSPSPSCLQYLLGREDIQKNFVVHPVAFVLFVAVHSTADALELCLRNGVDVNARDYKGCTVIHAVCLLLFSKTVRVPEGRFRKWILPRMRLLIRHGANPNARSHSGETPRDLIEMIRMNPEQWNPNVTTGDFEDVIALLKKHEQGGLVGQGAV